MTVYLEECNVKLAGVKATLKIYIRNNRLYLRGTLPIRKTIEHDDGDNVLDTATRKQYKLSSGLSVTQNNIRYLFTLSLEVTRRLERNTFTWQWLDTTLKSLSPAKKSSKPKQSPNTSQSLERTKPLTRLTVDNRLTSYEQFNPKAYVPILISQVNQALESLRYQRVIIKGIKESTWQLEYLRPIEELRGLALSTNQNITPALIQSALLSIPKDSRKRKRYLSTYRLLLKELRIDYNLDNVLSTYSYTSVLPKLLPSDEQIVSMADYLRRKDQQWYGAYCYLAIYGLRNTELLEMDYSHYPNVLIKSSKTGKGRFVLPFHQQWIDQFSLTPDVKLPAINRKDAHSFSNAVTSKFRQLGFTFTPKSLRHAYARRMAELNYPTIYAAHLMGHSLKVHESTYMNFIGLKSYELARQQYMPATY